MRCPKPVLSGLVFLAVLSLPGLSLGGRARRPRSYKKSSFPGLEAVEAGDYAKAAAFFQKRLAQMPDDLEAMYGLVAALAGMGKLDEALATARKAVEAGLPVERFVAGPRDWFKALVATEGFKDLFRRKGKPLLHGPMVGRVTDHSAAFWVRTAAESRVEVVVGTGRGLAGSRRSPVARTSAARDYTVVVEVGGLKPSRRYHYQVFVDGAAMFAGELPSFETFPPAGRKARFRVAFGGGAGYVPWNEKMWDVVRSHAPLAFLFLGDNVYIDRPTLPALQRYCYYRRQSRPEFRRLVASTACYAIWDDHDFGTNDCAYGSRVDEPAWKVPVWRVFCQNWNNPYYGGGEAQPGCWFHFSIGDVDFFLLDGRFYRSKPRGPEPTMLGPAQKRWLLARLKASKATFKVLASGVPWALGTKPGSLDTWEGFKAEREEILSFIEKNRIGGVVLLSADRHRSDIWRLKRQVGYPLYEFESSRLTNQHRHGKIPGAVFSYNEKQSFGLLTFDTTKPDPTVTYEIYNIDDQKVHAFTLRKSQLTPKR